MGLRGDRLQLDGIQWGEVDIAAARRSLRPLYGRIVVEMAPSPDRIGSIWMPDSNRNARPDVGTVVATHGVTFANRRKSDGIQAWKVAFAPGVAVPCPDPGTRVAFRPYAGTRFSEGCWGTYRPSDDVLVFGMAGEDALSPWWDFVLAEVDEVGEVKIVTGDNVLIRMDEAKSREGGIILPDAEVYDTGMATVEMAGPLCEVQKGDRVCVDVKLLMGGGLQIDHREESRLWITPESAILMVVNE